jgi:hypothetical protein
MGSDDHRKLGEFIDETRASQRNIVFPDTARNGRSVDAFLWRGVPNPTTVQRIGAWIWGVVLIGCGLSMLFFASEIIHAEHKEFGDWLAYPICLGFSGFTLLWGARILRNFWPKREAKPQTHISN